MAYLNQILKRFGIRSDLRIVVLRWFYAQDMPVLLSWKLFSKDERMQIHRCAAKAAFPRSPRYLAWGVIVVSALSWPIRSLCLIYSYTRRFGTVVRREEGKGLIQQVVEQIRLAFSHSLSSRAYYTYSLHRKENAKKALGYIHDAEIANLLPLLNRYQSTTILDDKLAFLDLCAQNNLATTVNVAIAEKGQLNFCADFADGLPRHDIFVKNIVGCHGAGAMLWESKGDFYQCEAWHELRVQGISLPKFKENLAVVHRGELARLLAQLSLKRGMLVQLRLRSHASLADLAAGSLLSARILTGHDQDGVHFLRATLRIPLLGDATNNDGLSSPIEEKSGKLGEATFFGPDAQRFASHPQSGALIGGRVLPDWQQAVELAVRGHRMLPQFTFIGWDVAFAETHPVLLEGNWGWGIETLQKPHQSPLTDTRFTAICLQRIAQINGKR